MFSSKNTNENTACYMAKKEGQLELLHKLWEWAKNVQTPEELKGIILAIDESKRPPGTWH
jgi:hypothetical protein